MGLQFSSVVQLSMWCLFFLFVYLFVFFSLVLISFVLFLSFVCVNILLDFKHS